jgi:hypothetical protein
MRTRSNVKIFLIEKTIELGMVVHTCNPRVWEAMTGESGVQGQPGLQTKQKFQY